MQGRNNSSPTSSISEIDHLSFFRIYKTSTSDQKAQIRVFSNGRQQCPIKIAMAFRDKAGNELTFTAQDVIGLVRLIDYSTMATLSYGDDPETTVAWRETPKKNIYEWDESRIDEVDMLRRDLYAKSHDMPLSGRAWEPAFFERMQQDPEINNLTWQEFHEPSFTAGHESPSADAMVHDIKPANTVEITLYVSTGQIESKEIAAQVYKDAKVLTHTAHRDARDDDGYGGGKSEFNSSVIAMGRTPYRPEPIPPYFGQIGDNGKLVRTLIRSTASLFFFQSRISIYLDRRPLKLAKVDFTRDIYRQAWRHGFQEDGKWWSVFLLTNIKDTEYTFDNGQLHFMGQSNGANKRTLETLVTTVLGDKKIRSPLDTDLVIGQLSGSESLYPFDASNQALGIKRSMYFDIVDSWGTDHSLELQTEQQAWCIIRRAFPHRNVDDSDGELTSTQRPPQVSDVVFDGEFRGTFKGRIHFESSATRVAQPNVAIGDIWSYPRIIQDPKINIISPRIYANGRAQTQILLTMQVMDRNEKSQLTDDEIQTIRLIRYRDGKAFPLDPTDPKKDPPVDGWTSSRTFRGYLEYPDSLAPIDRGAIDADYITLYLSADEAALGRDMPIAFEVTLNQKSDDPKAAKKLTIQTNGNWKADDEKEGYDLALDTRDQNIVKPMAPAFYSADQFRIEPTTRPPSPRYDAPLTVYITHLGRSIGIRSMTCEPKSIIHWTRYKDSSYTNPCFIGFAQPNETKVEYHEGLSATLESIDKNHLGPATTTIIRDRGIIMLCARVGFNYLCVPDPPAPPVDVTIVDVYGTTHQLSLSFKNGTRDELQLL